MELETQVLEHLGVEALDPEVMGTYGVDFALDSRP